MAGELTAREKVVGLKQTRRAVSQGSARRVYLACDADPALTEPLAALCKEHGVEADCSLTMQQLGRARHRRTGLRRGHRGTMSFQPE